MDALFDLNGARVSDPAIARWWDSKPPDLSAIARTWFEAMKACGTEVLEVMHDDYPTACVGRYAFAYVGVFSAHVNVGIFYGVSLPDPHGLLEGSGKKMRHVKLRPGKPVPADALHALVEAAYADLRRRIAALPGERKGKQLTDLANIGKTIAARLNEAGIFSEDELRLAGPAEAHRRIKALYPDKTIPVCYYLYAFEGALTGRHRDRIGEKRKKELLEEIGRSR